MVLNIDRRIDVFVLRVDVRALVKFLGFSDVALVLNLCGKFTANILLFLRGKLFGKFKCSEPILEIHSHVKSKHGIRGL